MTAGDVRFSRPVWLSAAVGAGGCVMSDKADPFENGWVPSKENTRNTFISVNKP